MMYLQIVAKEYKLDAKLVEERVYLLQQLLPDLDNDFQGWKLADVVSRTQMSCMHVFVFSMFQTHAYLD